MTRARGQDGLTLLETLVMIAVTALVGAALMNVAARANASNYSRAVRTLDLEAMRAAETELRRAGAAAEEVVAAAFEFTGDSRSASWRTIGYTPCAKGLSTTSFAIEAIAGGERFVRRCATADGLAGRSDVVARWPAGMRGDLAFSTDGFVWRTTPPSAEPRDPGGEQGVYLRLRLRGPGALERVSVVRVSHAASKYASVLEGPQDP
ncbi:MAG: hypothetical protein KJS97_15940 [Alphaproteobacteria bacterium]|nr:hypothetical protein [Alphaproteobacteria bacterium]